MPILTPGQERKRGWRWAWVAAVVGMLLVATGAIYAMMAWGPIPTFGVCYVGSVQFVCVSDFPSNMKPWDLHLNYYPDMPSSNRPHECHIQIRQRYYGARW